MKLKNQNYLNHKSPRNNNNSIGSYFLKCALRSFILLATMADLNLSLVGVQSAEVMGLNQQSYLVPEPTTRVMLISLERGPLLLITNVSNTDVVLTKAPGYFEAYTFECNATFPIQWSYVGDGAPIMTGDVGRSFTDFFDPSTYLYHSSMTMYALEEQNSGRYVCRGIESQYQRISAYLHLYVPGKNIFVSTMEKKITVAPHKDQITVPCGVSDPTVQINLYKGNNKGSFKRIETNSSITYNPRKGFRLQRQYLQEPFGKYLCVAAANKKRVRVNLVPKAEVYERQKREVLSNEINGVSEVLHFSYDNRHHRMLCCSASTIPPKLTFAGCTSIVDCEIKSGCFRENRCESREGNSAESGYYNYYLGLDPPGCTGHSLRDDPNGDFGLFLCADKSHTTLQYQPFLLNRGNLFMSFDRAPPADQVMTLTRATDEELFVGTETMFRCNTSRFFFGTGVRWAFERLNGDLEFLEDSEAISEAYFVNNHRRHTVLRIPHADIKAVVCVVPVWNSPTEWRMLSLPIGVSEIFHPPEYEALVQQTTYPSPTYASATQIGASVPQQQDQVGYSSGGQFHRRVLPALQASQPATQIPYTPVLPSPSQPSYRGTSTEEHITSTPEHNPHNLYENYVPNYLEVVPYSNNYLQSSSQYFYSNQNIPGETGVITPQNAIQFLNSTFDLSAIL